MIKRRLKARLNYLLKHFPAVVLLGPRQAGKTTLALEISNEQRSVYLDLESRQDQHRLANPEQYLADHEGELVVLDEVHRAPELFQSLRGIIDRGRRKGKANGRFLLLGSASLDLLRQSESLAGRIAYVDLGPFDALEVPSDALDKLWVRGGFPSSFLAADDDVSAGWRENFIRTYLERDVPQFGSRIPAETLRRFWTMLAHNQGQVFNAAALARAMGVDGKTVAGYLDLMVDLFLVRRLSAWHRNDGKRLIKAPKVYVRDSGIAHQLLDLRTKEAVLGHTVSGQTWETFVIETLVAVAPSSAQASFYRTSAGAEIDLLLELPNRQLWAVEIKRSIAPKVEKGFHTACNDLKPHRRFVVYPGSERFLSTNKVEAIGVIDLARELQALK